MAISAVTLGPAGPRLTCSDLNQRYCTAGTVGNSCVANSDCDTALGSGDGVCTAVTTTDLIAANQAAIDGDLQANPDTSQVGTFGYQAEYQGGQNYNNAADPICTDLTVAELCTGATITIERASGNGAPPAGATSSWTIDVVVRACEQLYNVSAQGGSNGWAPLKDRSAAYISADTGTAKIRNANRKNEVILWNIGNMSPGQTAKLSFTLEGSIPAKTADCSLRYLTGAWSALFSTDGVNVQKTDYTGRVAVQVDSNGDGNPPGSCP